MKKFCAALCIAFFTLACGGGGGSDSDEGYKLEPGSLTKYSDPGTTCDISYTGAPGAGASVYAVIYKGEINGSAYVGVSLDVDGDPTTEFNLKLYFQASDIPSSITLTKGTTPGFGIKIDNGTIHDDIINGQAIDLNFAYDSGTNTYTITGGGDKEITVDSINLTINSIKAYYISGN